MPRLPVGVLTILAAGFSIHVGTGAAYSQTPVPQSRVELVRALEKLIDTGQPGHADHDAGQLLQRAVDAAIRRGDREIEQLAVRAAAPLRARIIAPVGSTDAPPSLEITAQNILTVPKPVPYVARITASLDGGVLQTVWDQNSGSGGGFRIDTRLGPAAVRPGAHHLRLRAHLTFGDPERPAWVEVRDLQEIFYAMYDPKAGAPLDVRRLINGPASVAASEFDALLPDVPFGSWLARLLAANEPGESTFHWITRLCDDRTRDPGSSADQTAICSVVVFGVAGHAGEIWFRSGTVQLNDDRVTWFPLTPRFEGLSLGGATFGDIRLSTLPALLETDPAQWPVGDASIAPADITVSPAAPRAARPAKVTVTVHNRGGADLHRVLVSVSYITDSERALGDSRQFVVDIPAMSAVNVNLDAVFPKGFGAVMAQVLAISEHLPGPRALDDPTPEDGCAFRIVNPQAAPPAFLKGFGDMSGCRGK